MLLLGGICVNEVFKQALPVLQKLTASGFEAYFVGGSVRDLLIGKEIADVDIATSAFPNEVKAIFKKTFDTGIAHGTVTVKENGTFYEVTTFRTEGAYEDFRRPKEVTFIRSLTEDLRRRDFTMNAIAMDEKGSFMDPFLGREAIYKRQICAVGDPDERFYEDALRMMRAIRFVSQLDFELERKTRAALQNNKALLIHTAVERKRVEWIKLLRGKAVAKALPVLLESGLEAYLPGLKNQKKALLKLANWHFSPEEEESIYWLLVVCAVEPESAKVFLQAWKLANKQIYIVDKAYEILGKSPSDWTTLELYYAGKSVLQIAGRAYEIIYSKNGILETIVDKYNALPIHGREELVINGNDLMHWLDESPGPWLKKMIEKIEAEIVLGKLQNDSAAIKRWVAIEKS